MMGQLKDFLVHLLGKTVASKFGVRNIQILLEVLELIVGDVTSIDVPFSDMDNPIMSKT